MARRGDTISVVSMSQWQIDGDFVVTRSDFDPIAQLAAERLAAASPPAVGAAPREEAIAEEGPAPTTSVPSSLPELSTVPGTRPSTTQPPSTTERPESSDITTPDGSLIDPDLVLPDLPGWELTSISPYDDTPSEPIDCDAWNAIESFESWLFVDAEYRRGEQFVSVLVGKADRSSTAGEAVVGIANLSDCNEALAVDYEGLEYESSAIDVTAADAASTVSLTYTDLDPDFVFEFVAVSTDEWVAIVTSDTSLYDGGGERSDLVALAEIVARQLTTIDE